ncbi:galactose mutarotase-like protein [Exidia glandulosa HHB12029]|uniref:Galactose mutarotase-like protein n=1 Tax=Exidia glandulosa HHB12029 TaxID=1314781 RepID=A0A165EIM3_EXIGL|nr:galactose mutarotase-like protein [Exidia glandulosa HHB12029]
MWVTGKFAFGALLVAAACVQADDLDTIRERRKPFVVASAAVIDLTQAPSWLESLTEDGTWPDVNYAAGCPAQRSNWPAQLHWQRIVALASIYEGAYAQGALESLAGNSSVLDATLSAMDWWFQRDFTASDCLANGGATGSNCPCDTPGLWNTNWFSNVILIPRLVGQSCILLLPHLSDDELTTCISMTARAFSTFGTGAGFLAGANILDIASIGVSSGVLSNDTAIVADAFSRINAEVVVHPEVKVDGIKPDGSFSQHTGIIYNGNYGKDYTNDVLQLATESAGTEFESPSASRLAFVTLLNGTRWMIYENTKTNVLHYDFSVVGRFIAFAVDDLDRTAAISSILLNITQIDQLGDLWEDATLQSVAKQLDSSTGTANIGGLKGNRMFWSNDFMVHRGNNYVTSLRMFSNRTTNTECVNLANPLGFHLSDGTVYTHLDGTEYEDIAAAWDWNLIPGTTTDYGGTPLSCDTISKSGLESFVGGVSDGGRGIGVMRYTNPTTKALSWQKAWFFVDGDAQHVMVNSISSSTPGLDVYSVLDQRRFSGNIWVDAQKVKPDTGADAQRVQNFTHPETLIHGGVAYVFEDTPAARTLSVSAGPRSGNWSSLGTSTQPPTTVPLFAAWIHHPADQLSSPLAYTVFPGVSDNDALCDAMEKVDLTPLANEPTHMGLWDAKRRVAYGVVWSADAPALVLPSLLNLGGLTIGADQPLVFIANFGSLDIRKWTLTVADPTQSLTSATITLAWKTGSALPPQWGLSIAKKISVSFPQGANAGSSATVKVLH